MSVLNTRKIKPNNSENDPEILKVVKPLTVDAYLVQS